MTTTETATATASTSANTTTTTTTTTTTAITSTTTNNNNNKRLALFDSLKIHLNNFYLLNLNSSMKKFILNNILRALILFTMGSLLAFVLNILQMEYKSNLFPSNVLLFLQTTWWAIPSSGIAAVYIGISYPFFDHKFGQCHHNDREWGLIIRCVALFIGLNHLCAKITFANSSHFLVILIAFCFVFWYWFDKTRFGLIFNITNAILVLIAAHVLRSVGIFRYSEIQFSYLQTCLSCLAFSGGVTFGNIGRLLDFYDVHHSNNNHSHSD